MRRLGPLLLVIAVIAGCGKAKVVLSPGEEIGNRGEAAYLGGDLQGAAELYQQALAEGGETTKLYNNLGNAFFRQKRYNAAEQAYRKALQLDPEYLFSLNNLAQTLYHAGDREEARRLMAQAQDVFPSVSFFYTTVGYFDFREGRGDSARKHFEKAVALNPDSPAALNNLGMLFLENPSMGQDPLPYLKRALEKGGDNKLFHDSLGWYYYKKGMFADATLEIGKAFAYDPENMEVRVHYATVLEWIGKDGEALEQWEEVLRLADERKIRKLAQEHIWEIKGRGVGTGGAG
jgi:tetratricopeptide (TPR) repeat protein